MGNMSYCRFENTYSDLLDCKNALDNEGVEDLSKSEKQYAIDLVNLCQEIIDRHENLIDSF